MYTRAWRNRRMFMLILACVYFLFSWIIFKSNVLDVEDAVSNVEQKKIMDVASVSRKPFHGAVDFAERQLFRNVFDISIEPSTQIGRDNTTHKEKYFIYRCDENSLSLCGGWLNRIKGAVVAYLIANLTGRTYKMENKMRSCDFHRYIVPNHVDWHLPVSLHETVRSGADVSILYKIDDRRYLSDVNHDFLSNVAMNKRFVYFKANIEYFIKFKNLRRYQKQLSWMQNLTYTQIVNALYRRLYKPSAYLQNKTEAFLKSNLRPHEKLVCTQLRTGPNPSNPQDVQAYKVTDKGYENTWNFLENMTKLNDSRIFLMSDSDEVIRRAKSMSFGDKVFSSPGKMVHIDRSHGVPAAVKCEGLEKIIFEHYVLLHCDVLLISRSSIGVHAASVRDTDKGLYCLHDSGNLRSCKRTELVQIFDYGPLI